MVRNKHVQTHNQSNAQKYKSLGWHTDWTKDKQTERRDEKKDKMVTDSHTYRKSDRQTEIVKRTDR